MYWNYFITAFRNFSRNKFYSFLNVLGLAIGVGGFLVLGVYVKSEWSFDRFHEKGDRIYRVVETQRLPGVEEMDVAITMPPLAPLLNENFPEIEAAVRMGRLGTGRWEYRGQTFTDQGFSFADTSFFDLFTFPLISGDPATALSEPRTLILTESFAKKIFGNENPVGKQIDYIRYANPITFEVTGVMKDLPKRSHLQFTTLTSYATRSNPGYDQSWGNSLMTYLLLNNRADAADLESKFPAFLERVIPEDKVWAGGRLDLYLQPLDEIHLESNHIRYQVQNYHEGNLSTLYIFAFVSILLIVVACINYMNLATARAAKRAGEVGVRKVFGSDKKSLVSQFLIESMLVAVIATGIGFLFAWYLLPYFREVMEINFQLSLLDIGYLPMILLGIALVVGLLAGLYPAFALSSFRPVNILKGSFYQTRKGAILRKVLVVTQFSIAAVLLVVSGFIWNQMVYISNKDVGFNRDQVIYVRLQANEQNRVPVFKQEIERLSGVASVSSANSRLPYGSGDRTFHVTGEETEKSVLGRNLVVDPGYIETMEMKIVQGRDFSPDIAADSVSSILVNEALVRALDWEHPIGKRLQYGSDEDAIEYNVIGVVSDFNYFSLREGIDPLVMRMNHSGLPYLLARIKPGQTSSTVTEIEKLWNNILSENRSFSYEFLDDHMATLYQSDQNYGKLISGFTGLAIIIACLGILGLAAFMAEQKTKEIGIRKVLGSTAREIVLLINKPFLKLIGVALLVAVPAGYWLGNRWLQEFKFYDQPGLLLFIAAAGAVVIITVLTVSYQAYRASQINPADALQYE